jgi:hypothetical protein
MPPELPPIEIPPEDAQYLQVRTLTDQQKEDLRRQLMARHRGPGPSLLFEASQMQAYLAAAFRMFEVPKSAFFKALEPYQRVIEANLERAFLVATIPITPLAPIRRFKRAMAKAKRKHPHWRFMLNIPADETLAAMQLASGQRVWTDGPRPPR